jgi:hypothetical protein
MKCPYLCAIHSRPIFQSNNRRRNDTRQNTDTLDVNNSQLPAPDQVPSWKNNSIAIIGTQQFPMTPTQTRASSTFVRHPSTTALGRPPFASRQVVDLDSEGAQGRAGGRRVALAGLYSSVLMILDFRDDLVKQGCPKATRMPQARHHRRHRPVNLTHGQLRIFPPGGPGGLWRGTGDSRP